MFTPHDQVRTNYIRRPTTNFALRKIFKENCHHTIQSKVQLGDITLSVFFLLKNEISKQKYHHNH